MSSTKDAIAAFDAVEAAYNAVAALSLQTLTRSDQQAILTRYGKLTKLLADAEQRMRGRLITEAKQSQFRTASRGSAKGGGD